MQRWLNNKCKTIPLPHRLLLAGLLTRLTGAVLVIAVVWTGFLWATSPTGVL